MINPNGDDFTQHDPVSGSGDAGETHISPGGAPRFQTGGTGASSSGQNDGWREKRERAEFFLRENPIPTILGALTIGIAVGLAIRFASEHEEAPKVETKALGNVDLSFLTLPFLWPFFKTAKSRAEDAADVVKERVNEGVDRLKKVDVDDYVKPLRKKWRSWTR